MQNTCLEYDMIWEMEIMDIRVILLMLGELFMKHLLEALAVVGLIVGLMVLAVLLTV